MGLLLGVGLIFHSFGIIDLVVLVKVLLHINHMSLILCLHLEVTTPMQVLTDSNTRSIDIASHCSRRCYSLWIIAGHLLLVVWSLEIIVTARSSLCRVLKNLGYILTCEVV